MTLLNSHPLVLDKRLATIIGLNEALVLQQVHYWLEVNKKNNRNFHEGRYWTYNTMDEWQEEFPFWSKSTIKRVFKRLRDKEILETDNFNIYQMDRTLWYTINYDKIEELHPSEEDKEDFADEFEDEEKVHQYNIERKAQYGQMIGSNEVKDSSQNEPMEGTDMTSALPETSSEISPDICNPSINLSNRAVVNNKKYYGNDGLMDNTNISYNEFETKFKRIIESCEIYAIDEKYISSVDQAIKLLLLDIGKGDNIKLGNNYIPAKIVEKDMEKLNFFVIQHAVNKFKQISSNQVIRNPVAYLKTLIYNSINEVEIDIDSKLRYEGLVV